MADSAVVITSGTGTNIDTRTEGTNGNHRQVVVIGDPATNAGVAPVDATAGLKVDLGADNDVTVTGTVDLGATDNAVLDAIAASAAAIDTDATTIIGHVDGIETLLGTIDADTSNLSTKIDTIAGDTTAIQAALETVGGLVVNLGTNNDVTVTGTVTAELSATDNAVLDNIDSDLTTIIGHVDGLETLIGTTNTTLTTIDGRVDGIEGLLTTIDGDTGNIVTSVQLLDDTVATDGSATPTKGILMAGQDGTNAQTVKTDSDGNLQVDVLTMPTTTITGTVDLGATDNAVLDTIAAKDFATQTTLAAINAKLVTGTDIGDVTINNAGGAAAVNIQDGGNTITVDGTVAVTNSDITSVKTATELLDDTVFVDDADWTADTSKHLLVGGVTQVATTANTDGDVTPLTTNAFRELRTAIPESDLATAGTSHVKKYYTNAGAVTDGIVWSPAAGKRWYVTDLIINVSAAATVTFEDDKAGGDEAVMKFELAANSGVSHTFNTPWFSGEDAADLLVTTSAGNIYISITGYEV